jgi:hypothetical protein
MNAYYFKFCKTLEEVKALYKKLAMKHHPDRGGETRVMQAVNAEYESIRKNPFFKFDTRKEESQRDFVEFPDIINKIISYKDITIELCGNWIWLSGATYEYKDVLKEIGFLFAGEKKLWYWRPHDYKSANRKPITIDAIRSKYGSDVYAHTPKKEIEKTP